ncbi:MAG TPA: hypothetical protein DCQ31_09805 [Bacteroidales bacterium]|nr:hypothetical protein [Bacteroidales bacterium]
MKLFLFISIIYYIIQSILAIHNPSIRLKKNELTLTKIEIPQEFAKKQLSGLAWYRDSLLFVLPERLLEPGGCSCIFAIRKDVLTTAFSTQKISSYQKISIQVLPNVDLSLAQGFEALCFVNDTVFLTLERDDHTAFLLKGIFYASENKIQLIKSVVIEHKLNKVLRNATMEGVLFFNQKLYCFHESNGIANNNSTANASVYNTKLEFVEYMPMDALEYRLTDVSAVANKKFYALNYYYFEKEFKNYRPDNDLLLNKISQNDSHFRYIENNSYLKKVERIVEFKITENRIVLNKEKVYYLKLDQISRNIEGIEILTYQNKNYFIISTDAFPDDGLYFTKMN